MKQTMRAQVWAMKDAGRSAAETALLLGIRPSEVKIYLRTRVSPRREREAEQFAKFKAAMMRGESLKASASEAGVCQQTGARWAHRMGLAWMYVSEAERHEIVARRGAERTAA